MYLRAKGLIVFKLQSNIKQCCAERTNNKKNKVQRRPIMQATVIINIYINNLRYIYFVGIHQCVKENLYFYLRSIICMLFIEVTHSCNNLFAICYQRRFFFFFLIVESNYESSVLFFVSIGGWMRVLLQFWNFLKLCFNACTIFGILIENKIFFPLHFHRFSV